MSHRLKYKTLIVVCIALAVVAFAMVLMPKPSIPVVEQPVQVLPTETDARTLTTEFVSHLKNVPVTAAKELLQATIQSEYGSYVTDELLQKWLLDPSTAPGRPTSSPWPDHLEISSVTTTDAGGYYLEGEVVYLTSVETPSGISAVRENVNITTIPVHGVLKISQYQQSPITPETSSKNELIARIQKGGSISGVVVVPTKIIEDSRCPMNARCIQAGTIKVAASVTTAGKTTTHTFELGADATIVSTKKIRLISVTPETVAGTQIKPSEYVFVFSVE